jgi:hypothetical protein
MNSEDSSYCIVKIKQDTVPWTWNQNNPALRKKRQEELAAEYERNYYKILNAVIEAGGVFCMDKNTLDSEYRIMQNTVKIKIPNSKVEAIKALAGIESFAIDNRLF